MDQAADTTGLAREQMKRKWESLAAEAPMYWVASGRTDWSLAEFYSEDSWFGGETLLEFLDRLGIDVRGKTVLDLGCGMGRISVHFARYGAEVYGTDISEEMIRLARTNLARTPRLHFDVGDGATLAHYRSGFFDVVWSYITFRHIPSRDVILGYIREIARALVPGGRFIIEVGNFRGGQWFLKDDLALRIGLKRTGRLARIGMRVRPTGGLVRYNAFAGARVPKRVILERLRDSGLSADHVFSYDPYDHMFYEGHKSRDLRPSSGSARPRAL
jgi:SAM-dependent methyltransferase